MSIWKINGLSLVTNHIVNNDDTNEDERDIETDIAIKEQIHIISELKKSCKSIILKDNDGIYSLFNSVDETFDGMDSKEGINLYKNNKGLYVAVALYGSNIDTVTFYPVNILITRNDLDFETTKDVSDYLKSFVCD